MINIDSETGKRIGINSEVVDNMMDIDSKAGNKGGRVNSEVGFKDISFEARG